MGVCGAPWKAPGARYPWGDEPPDATRADYRGGGPGSPTPVGLYPSGASFDGVQDMAGNVWEWTASDYSDWRKVLRGGAWYNSPKSLRVSYRFDHQPKVRNDNFGFRCIRELPSR
jgi:formylglycine-generating enzyme required for sulfatase activity